MYGRTPIRPVKRRFGERRYSFFYLIRQQGKLSIETDRHVLGLFSLAVWQDLLRQAGFVADLATYEDDREQYPSFFCVKA